MSEILRFFLLQIGLISIVLVLHTYLGLHIIRRTLVFSDLALDQLAALGALIGIALGVSYGTPASYLLSLVAVLFGAFLLAVLKPHRRTVPREAVIGIIYALTLIISIMLTDKLPGGDALLTKTFSGIMSWVSGSLVAVTGLVYLALLIFHIVFRRQFIALVENPDAVHREKWWDFLFFTTQGIITVLIVPIAGVFLAYVFLMIPAAIAALFTRKWLAAVLLGWSIGLVACIIGLSSSFYFDWPYCPSMVLCLGLCFVVAVIVRIILNHRMNPKKESH